MITTITTRDPVHTVLQTGDLHLQSRELEDQQKVLAWIAGQVASRDVGLVVVAGDIAGMACPHLSRPAEREAFRTFLHEVTPMAPVVVLRGNHDVAADWRWLGSIPNVRWVERPETFLIGPHHAHDEYPGDMLVLHALPYPDRGWIAAQTESAEETTQRMSQALRAIVAGFTVAGMRPGETPTPYRRQILSAHINTGGALASTGQPLIGTDVEMPAEWLEGFPVVLLNHIHLPQDIGNAHHVGSPWPNTFGEEEEKSISVVSWEAKASPVHATRVTGHLPIVDRVWTPAPKRYTTTFRWAPESSDWEHVEGRFLDLAGARVRLKLIYDEGDPIDIPSIERACEDALSVKIERNPVPRRRERSPEVVAATDPVERFVAFEESEGREVDDFVRDLATDFVAAVL